jgi:apolipoprotein N-acyltransferase
VREMHLGGPDTLATRSGRWPETVGVVLALFALAGALPLRRRRPVGAVETIAEAR